MDEDLIIQTTGLLEKAEELRAKLTDERRGLLARVDQIDVLLRRLPGDSGSGDDGVNVVSLEDETSAPMVVLSVLRQGGGRPMKAQEVIDKARGLGSELADPNLHSALSRLTRDGRIGRIGERGSYQFYALPEEE